MFSIHPDKRIGKVLFIVEGSKTEFLLIHKIFCNLFHYTYIEKKRNTPSSYIKYINGKDEFSEIAVINTEESNIKFISDPNKYLDSIFELLIDQYHFPIDQAAIYYIFDRDAESNTNPNLICNYIQTLKNPYENDDYMEAGQLLLSYPSIESYIVSNFIDDTESLSYKLGSDVKHFIGQHKEIQLNKISESTLLHAAQEFLTFLSKQNMTCEVDDFSETSLEVFQLQELLYNNNGTYLLFSMFTLALLQLGLIEYS